ncbi:MAG: hypothetical protein E6J34_01630 [Chloroflexi bacterium]|nr:MAG: hypothetical protein E6J34_01630 [Chloroflexota bacterium]
MAKKSAAARGGAQRNRPKTQKNIELVRAVPEKIEQEAPSESVSQQAEPAPARIAATTTTESNEKSSNAVPATTVQKGSATARLAARRQAGQKVQQRSNASLITSEHFAYVRRDLITIAVLASCMFAIIIVLFFVFGSSL